MVQIVHREDWGAPASRDHISSSVSVRGQRLHYIGPAAGLVGAAHDACVRNVRAQRRFHVVDRGWADIAYSFLVCPHGLAFEGRGWDKRTAANGTNACNDVYLATQGMIGVGERPTEAMLRAIAELWVMHDERYGSLRVGGHRDCKSTECPGDPLYRWLPSWRQSLVAPEPEPEPKDDDMIELGSRGQHVRKARRMVWAVFAAFPELGQWTRDAAGISGQTQWSYSVSTVCDEQLVAAFGIVQRRILWGPNGPQGDQWSPDDAARAALRIGDRRRGEALAVLNRDAAATDATIEQVIARLDELDGCGEPDPTVQAAAAAEPAPRFAAPDDPAEDGAPPDVDELRAERERERAGEQVD